MLKIIFAKGEILTYSRKRSDTDVSATEIREYAELHRIKEVQADGVELTWILQTFRNIPHLYPEQLTRWTGVYADFIVSNLFE